MHARKKLTGFFYLRNISGTLQAAICQD